MRSVLAALAVAASVMAAGPGAATAHGRLRCVVLVGPDGARHPICLVGPGDGDVPQRDAGALFHYRGGV